MVKSANTKVRLVAATLSGLGAMVLIGGTLKSLGGFSLHVQLLSLASFAIYFTVGWLSFANASKFSDLLNVPVQHKNYQQAIADEIIGMTRTAALAKIQRSGFIPLECESYGAQTLESVDNRIIFYTRDGMVARSELG